MKLGGGWPGLRSPAVWAAVALATLLLVGSFYNLANYPTLWWDEGIFSETAANIVQHGRYAFTVQSPDELSDLDYRISAGPMVILPVALAYRLLGVGVVPGRLVAGAYLVLAFAALFLGARRLWGSGVALGAVALAIFGTDAIYWGRSVLGDVPALGLFLCGLWCLSRALSEPASLPHLFLGGMFLGLAFDAKEFYGLAFVPPVVLLALQARRNQGPLMWRLLIYGAGLALPLFSYLLLKAIILKDLSGAVAHFLLQKKLLCHEFFTPLTIGRIYPESLVYLLSHPLFWLGLLGAVWIWRREKSSLGESLWIANFFIWSGTYLTAVYWQRFALPALFLASGLAAHFLAKAAVRLTANFSARAPAWLSAGMLLALASAYPLPGVDFLGQVARCRAHCPSSLVKFLRDNIPTRCLIETPEYELAFLDDDHRIHLMPEYFFVESTPDKIVLLNPRPKPYDFNKVGADFLIIGTFGKTVFKQIYSPALIFRDWRRIARVGYYDIYVSRKSEKALKHSPILARKHLSPL